MYFKLYFNYCLIILNRLCFTGQNQIAAADLENSNNNNYVSVEFC